MFSNKHSVWLLFEHFYKHQHYILFVKTLNPKTMLTSVHKYFAPKNMSKTVYNMNHFNLFVLYLNGIECYLLAVIHWARDVYYVYKIEIFLMFAVKCQYQFHVEKKMNKKKKIWKTRANVGLFMKRRKETAPKQRQFCKLNTYIEKI